MDSLNKQVNVKGEDKNLHSFILLFAIMTVLLLLTLFSFFTVSYKMVSQITEIIKLCIMSLIIFALALLIIIGSVIIHVYRKNLASSHAIWIARIGLSFILPVVIALSEFINFHKNEIRQFYIYLNNLIIKSLITSHKMNKILILLPHCLQNTDCVYKLTTDINNCHKCFRCSVGYIVDHTKNIRSISVTLASGGSSARNIVYKTKPDLIIAVACERDLVSGIADVRNIPTLGILNKRPNGPCCNTELDLKEFKDILEYILT